MHFETTYTTLLFHYNRNTIALQQHILHYIFILIDAVPFANLYACATLPPSAFDAEVHQYSVDAVMFASIDRGSRTLLRDTDYFEPAFSFGLTVDERRSSPSSSHHHRLSSSRAFHLVNVRFDRDLENATNAAQRSGGFVLQWTTRHVYAHVIENYSFG